MTPASWEEMADPADEFLQVPAVPASGTAWGVLQFAWHRACTRNRHAVWCSTRRRCTPCLGSLPACLASNAPAPLAAPACALPQKGPAWLFPRTSDGTEAAADKPQAGVEKDPAEPPYRPSPLRFLRRNKTTPLPGSSGSSTESTDSFGAQPAAQQQPYALQGASAPGTAPFAAAGAAINGSGVPRNHTWPVYQNPVVVPSPLQAGVGNLLPLPVHTAVAVEVQARGLEVQRPSPPHSHSTTPQDSLGDVEAGHAQSPGDTSESPAELMQAFLFACPRHDCCWSCLPAASNTD
jgi:hypothetical protein